MLKNHLLLLATALLLSCKAGPDYKKPVPKLPELWQGIREAKNFSSNTSYQKWWKNFDDKILDDLISEAAKQNLDLKNAEAKIAEARAARSIAKSDLFLPDINASVNGERAQQFFPQNGNNFTYNRFDAGFDASWEIDLFGGKSRKLEAATASLAAIEAERDALMLSVLAEVARSYIDFRSLQNQLQIAGQNLEAEQKIAELMAHKERVGAISKIDFLKIKQQLDQDLSALPVLESAVKAAEYRIESLLGKQPGSLELVLFSCRPIPISNQGLILKTPASVMASRPDIKAAERRLAAAVAEQGVAISYQYPKINLAALVGAQSNEIHSLFASPNNIWQIGSGITLPLFSFGKVKSNINAAEARKNQAQTQYEQAVLNGLQDVETSLIAYLKEDQRRKNLTDAADSSKKITDLTWKRYNTGSDSMIDFLNARKSFYNLQTELTRSEAKTSINLIALYKAMGGFGE